MKKSTLKSIRRAKNVNVAAKKATIGAQTLKLSVMLMFILSSMNSLSSQVLISSDSGLPDNSAMLEVESTTQGFLPPRMTTSERDAISSPTEGLVIYNMDKKILDVFNGILWTNATGVFTCGDQIADSEGNGYNTVLIGNQCWMSENLNVGTMIVGVSNQTNNATIEKYCHGDLASNCDIYGGLYQWDEMMQYTTVESSQGLCPSGWHLPSDDEIKTLEVTLGMSQAEADMENLRGTNQGSQLAGNAASWLNTAITADPSFGSSGFTLLPAGGRNATVPFFQLNSHGKFWSSSAVADEAWWRNLQSQRTDVNRILDSKTLGLSVRCVQD